MSCGKLLWYKNGTSSPRGQVVCRDCRRTNRASKKDRRLRYPERACEQCGTAYRSAPAVRTCSQVCGQRLRVAEGRVWRRYEDATAARRALWQRKNHARRARERGLDYEPYTLLEIAERDDWVCHLCGEQVPRNVHYQNTLAPTVDHLIPVINGGPSVKANVALAHKGCNSRKQAQEVPSGGYSSVANAA